MKLSTIALAAALTMTSTVVFAQAGGAAPGGAAAIPENSGTATNAQGGAIGSVNPGTTGMSRSENRDAGARTGASSVKHEPPGGETPSTTNK